MRVLKTLKFKFKPPLIIRFTSISTFAEAMMNKEVKVVKSKMYSIKRYDRLTKKQRLFLSKYFPFLIDNNSRYNLFHKKMKPYIMEN